MLTKKFFVQQPFVLTESDTRLEIIETKNLDSVNVIYLFCSWRRQYERAWKNINIDNWRENHEGNIEQKIVR